MKLQNDKKKLVGADSPRALLKIDGYSGHLTQNAYTLAEILKDERLLHLHGR